jgi:hypothetical protein
MTVGVTGAVVTVVLVEVDVGGGVVLVVVVLVVVVLTTGTATTLKLCGLPCDEASSSLEDTRASSVHVPTLVNWTFNAPAEHTPGVSDVTEATPVLVVAMLAPKEPPTNGCVGKFVIVGCAGTTLPIVKLCGVPVAPA